MADPLTHSHDTATPALSVESEEENLRAVIGRSIANDCWFVKLYPFANETAALEARSRVLSIAAAPAPNPSPAAKGREALKITRAMIEAFYRETEVTREGSIRRIEDGLSAAFALATPSPQPADAVREAVAWSETTLLRYCNEAQAGRYPSDPREFERRVDAAFRTIRAALASDPAPAGEAVEPVAYAPKRHIGRYLTSRPKGVGACWVYNHPTAEDDDKLYLHPAPEDTARLREDLERVTQELEEEVALRVGAIDRMKAAERERDDARKAVETIAEEASVANEVIRLNRDGGGQGRIRVATAIHRIVQWTTAARSASRGGTSDE